MTDALFSKAAVRSQHFTERNLIVVVIGVLEIVYIAAGFASNIPTLLCISTGIALSRPTLMAALSVWEDS